MSPEKGPVTGEQALFCLNKACSPVTGPFSGDIRNVERHQVIGDDTRFVHSIILYTDGNDTFQACIPQRYNDDEINLSELAGIRIPPENIYPRFDGNIFSSAPDTIPDGCFLKHSNLIYYRTDDVSKLYRIRERMFEEAQICEDLMKSPHRNIACYMGCQVREGRIVALCFKKYRETLVDRVGRDGLNKARCIDDIRKGIEHIHSLGYCHNDINPTNIMFDEHDIAVIIDFDSSRPTGHELAFKTGSPHFGDISATRSEASNDFYGLSKIEDYLDVVCGVE